MREPVELAVNRLVRAARLAEMPPLEAAVVAGRVAPTNVGPKPPVDFARVSLAWWPKRGPLDSIADVLARVGAGGLGAASGAGALPTPASTGAAAISFPVTTRATVEDDGTVTLHAVEFGDGVRVPS